MLVEIILKSASQLPGGGKYGGNGGILGAAGAPGSGGCVGIIFEFKIKLRNENLFNTCSI